MKNSRVITVLVMTACVLGIVVLGFAVLYEVHYRDLRKLQKPLQEAQTSKNLVNLLASDALEYSKTHPAIDSILAPVGVKGAKPSTPAGKSGSK